MGTIKKTRFANIFSILCLCLIAEQSVLAGVPESKKAALIASVPSWIQLQLVGQDLKYNGVSMMVYQIDSQKNIQNTQAYYANRWTQDNPESIQVHKAGQWDVISKVEKSFLYSLQLQSKAAAGAFGFLSVSDMPTDVVNRNSDFPKLPGTQVLSVVQSQDKQVQGLTLVLENSASVRSNLEYYASKMPEEGWTISQTSLEPNGRLGHLWFTAEDKTLQITLKKYQGQTQVVTVISEQ